MNQQTNGRESEGESEREDGGEREDTVHEKDIDESEYDSSGASSASVDVGRYEQRALLEEVRMPQSHKTLSH